ncbi:MAG: response regulator [Anaerolineae bacterium]
MSDNTVLIVDDEEFGRETVGDLLIPQGFHLIFAANGPEALEKAAAFTPDVILLDVMMPGMDGFEVCRRLRADPLLAEVPVIMVTALDDRASRLQGLESGADDFISKPFDRLELRARVKTIIRLNRYRRLLTERGKFEWVVTKANEGYLTLNDNDEILYANPQARLWLGLAADAEAPYPDTFLALAKARYHCEPQELWLTWPELPPMATSNTSRYLVRPETPTATTLWLQVEQLLMESGSAETYLLRLYDVTASKLNQSIMWGFHAQVSHKLRTPSTLLTGFLEIVQDGISSLSETQLQACLATAHKNALQLQDQIQHIFRYLEIPRLGHPERIYCGVSEVATIVAEIKIGLGLESVSISAEAIAQLEQSYLVLSRQEVELILWELLENARKFHPSQTPAVEINLKPYPVGIQLEVADNGLTLSSEQLAKVWQPYYQGEKYFTGQMPGMGLGLSMVSTLVWRAGGACRMYNRPGGPGVVVELVLPLKA